MSRMKPQQEFYRPGCGRLKKSGQGMENIESNKFDSRGCFSDSVESRNQEQRYLAKMPERNSGSSNEINKLSDNINNLSISKSELGSTNNLTDKRKNKKPEKAIYIPKSSAHGGISRDFVDKSYTENRNIIQDSSTSQANASRSDIKNQSYKSNSNLSRDSRNGCNSFGSTDRLNSSNKRSRKNNHRRHTQEIEYKNEQDNWRTSSPSVQSRIQNRRDYRQSSEPRTIEPSIDPNRMRDTRSVEPVDTSGLTRIWQPGKIQNKPPSGRRNSSVSLCGEREIVNKVQKPPSNLDSLPPRFKKKYLAESGYMMNYGSNCEGTWDGSSVTFKGTSTDHHSQINCNKTDTQLNRNISVPYTHMSNIHEHNLSQSVIHGRGMPKVNQTYMSQTLPNMRSRGRGRLRIEDMDAESSSQQQFIHRPHTPDPAYFNSPYNSRPNTPPNYSNCGRTYSNEQLNYGYSRSQTPIQEQAKFKKPYKVQQTISHPQVVLSSEQSKKENVPQDIHLSPLSPPTPPPSSQHISSNEPVTLDWSEEVELHAEIEEALSDTMTRSSSVASLTDPSNNTHSRRERRSQSKRRNRKRRDRSRRSSSRNERTQRDQSLDSKNLNNKNSSSQEKARLENEKTQNASQAKVSQNRNYHYNNQQTSRTHSNDRNRNRRYSRDSSNDRSRKNSESESKNWRERKNSEKDSCNQAPGILVLPKDKNTESSHNQNLCSRAVDSYQNISRNNIQPPQHSNPQQKILFDPNNPNKPIVVTSSSTRTSMSESNSAQSSSTQYPDCQISGADNSGPAYITDQFGNVRMPWYDPLSKNFHASHNPRLIIEIERVDLQLQWIINSGGILRDWKRVLLVRQFLQQSLQELLKTDLKFCQTENVEYHFWKILFYNIIELMRKSMINDAEHKNDYKEIMLYIIEDGSKYLEGLLQVLETVYSFKLDDFLGSNIMPPKGLGIVGLALISAQKIYLFLGDLARYKEEVNETTNYWKSRQWYTKAQEINPKNGRPYNQLAILAMYSRKRLDAIYYYMRSLMSSNPFHSARERLTSLFDDIRKKYEQGQRKRREERAERLRLQMKEREKTLGGNSLRREIWVHPEDGRRLHRTTNTQPQLHVESDDDLSKLSCSDVNKRFVISYLHIQGKLITRIGMESFQEAALQMLKEFRTLLQHSPVPLSCKRLLKLLALNMFAIENSQLKDAQLDQGYRSEVQECALIVSLQMFSLILERCVSLLKEELEQPPETPYTRIVGEDMQILLPAVKVWCDWMLCHNFVWNPPPSCSDYRVGPPGDAWSRLAMLMNLLKKLDYQRTMLVTGPKEGYEPVRLPEDAVLCGFTPLMYNTKEMMYANSKEDMEVAQICLRIRELIFFGTEFLCGQDPPVLKLQKFESGHSEYISVVSAANRSGDICEPHDDALSSGFDILVESFSEDEDDTQDKDLCLDISDATTPEGIRDLLQRKEELERKQERQERHRQRVQAILQQSVVSVEIEIRPHYLVPDTNCFIDYLSQLQTIAKVQMNTQPVYILMIPLIVLNELEGLARGGRTPMPVTRASLDPQHVVRVAEASRRALDFLHAGRNPAVRCVTTRGTILPTTNAMIEEDEEGEGPQRNDDRILTTALRLCRTQQNKDQQAKDGEPRRLVRDVVLLTDDRNLRVKALARDVPVRELPDFMKWAGLG